MQSFQTAKNLLSILVYVGWAFVALCVIAGVAALSQMSPIFAFIGAGLLSVVGFLIIGVAQMGLAQIATAENTGQMLEIMRTQGKLQSQETPANKTSTKPNSVNAVGAKGVGETIKTYKGYVIKKAQDGVDVEGEKFQNLLVAEKWINQNPK